MKKMIFYSKMLKLSVLIIYYMKPYLEVIPEEKVKFNDELPHQSIDEIIEYKSEKKETRENTWEYLTDKKRNIIGPDTRSTWEKIMDWFGCKSCRNKDASKGIGNKQREI